MSHYDDTVPNAVEQPGSNFTATPETSIVSPQAISPQEFDGLEDEYQPEGGRALRGFIVALSASLVLFWIPVGFAIYLLNGVIG